MMFASIPFINAQEKVFSDLNQNHWAYSAVQEMIERGVIKGFSDGTFRPNDFVTRAQFATMMVSALGIKAEIPENPSFVDISEKHWAYKNIETLSQTGILGEIRPILSKLVQMRYNIGSNQLTGKEIAENIGTLSNGLSVMLLGNNEGDTHLLPFYLKADDLLLAADGKGVAKGLGLDLNLLKDNYNTQYDCSNFFCELMGGSSNLTEGDTVTTKMNTLADYMLEYLFDIRALVLGRDIDNWDGKPVIDSLINTNFEGFKKTLGKEPSLSTISDYFDLWTESDQNGEKIWNSCGIPVLVVGTAPDGSLVGVLGIVIWT